MQRVAGAQVAAEAYADPGKVKKAFGFDIRGARLLPVQVVIDNTGSHDLQVVPDQTFLVDDQGNMWNLLGRHASAAVEGNRNRENPYGSALPKNDRVDR